jgi:hypothetical protein
MSTPLDTLETEVPFSHEEPTRKPPLVILPASEWAPGKEGIFRDLPADVYHAAPGVNVSSLKECRKSMRHYWYAIAKSKDDEPEEKHFVIGTCVHTLTLEPHLLAQAYVKRPAHFKDWRTNAAKEWRDSQTLPVITDEEEKEIFATVAAAKADPLIAAILQDSERELSCIKQHPRTGLLLKGRADVVRDDIYGERWVADIKTIGEGGTVRDEFSKQVAKRDYHMQAAFYSDLFEASHFVFIVLEKVPPHDVAMDELDALALEIGRRSNEAFLLRIAECKRSGEWPGNGGHIRVNKLPRWREKQDGEDLE